VLFEPTSTALNRIEPQVNSPEQHHDRPPTSVTSTYFLEHRAHQTRYATHQTHARLTRIDISAQLAWTLVRPGGTTGLQCKDGKK
jgi:hypothetical protein